MVINNVFQVNVWGRLPTLPIVSFSGHLILVTTKVASVTPTSGGLREHSIDMLKNLELSIDLCARYTLIC